MHIDNLNNLIAHLETQPPERINMGWVTVLPREGCGTCGCIKGHAKLVGYQGGTFSAWLGISAYEIDALTMPIGWRDEQDGISRYPAHRVIATLKRLRDTYLSTGQVVVDWGPEPDEEGDHWGSSKPWAAPQVAEIINPALPVELTRLLHDTVEA